MFVCLSVCLPAWNNSASTKWIFMKFDIWVFFENLSRRFTFHESLTRITGTLHESLCTSECTYKRDIEVCSCNHCGNGKAISITLAECVFLASVIQHAMQCASSVICLAVLCFFTLPHKWQGKGKAVPSQAWSGLEGSRKLRFPDFLTTAQEGGKVVSLTHRPYLPTGNSPGTHFC